MVDYQANNMYKNTYPKTSDKMVIRKVKQLAKRKILWLTPAHHGLSGPIPKESNHTSRNGVLDRLMDPMREHFDDYILNHGIVGLVVELGWNKDTRQTEIVSVSLPPHHAPPREPKDILLDALSKLSVLLPQALPHLDSELQDSLEHVVFSSHREFERWKGSQNGE